MALETDNIDADPNTGDLDPQASNHQMKDYQILLIMISYYSIFHSLVSPD